MSAIQPVVLSVRASVVDQDKLGEFIQSELLDSVLRSCLLVRRGVNDTYKLECDDGQELYARLSPAYWRTKGEILEELALIRIAARALPVAIPIGTRRKAPVLSLQAPEGPRFLAVFNKVEGEKIAIAIRDGATQTTEGYRLSCQQKRGKITEQFERGFKLTRKEVA